MPPQSRETEADIRRRRTALFGGVGLLILAVFTITQCGEGGKAVAADYAKAWERHDARAMYGLLSDDSKRRIGFDRFVELQQRSLAQSTARSFKAGKAKEFRDGAVSVPFTVETRAFGTYRTNARIPLTEDDSEAKVVWSESLLLPGVADGEALSRTTEMPPRADIFAADGSALAAGPNRAADNPLVSAQITGKVGEPEPAMAMTYEALGYPPGTPVGMNGLERALQSKLAGQPGGTLKAGTRVLASASPKAAKSVKTTIVPALELAAAAALAGRAGSAVLMDPKTGEVLAAAGSAFSGTAPPGSTFKIITATAALESGAATPDTKYPWVTEAPLQGRMIQNANGELCGGTLVIAFAKSCNSVFAPLGAKLGSGRLIETAERFGFNRSIPGIPGAALSTVPKSEELIGDDAVGSVAIGQGRTSASALQMATTAATVGAGGFRAQPSLTPVGRPTGWRVMSARTAQQMKRLMLAVVRVGTGTTAAIPGIAVAGKTGTAELVDTTSPDVIPNDPRNTDAWFVAFAPADRPRFAVAVELDGSGHGGVTAAPAARQLLVAAFNAKLN